MENMENSKDCLDKAVDREPTTSSDDPEERKTARALRITKREDAVKKLEAVADANGYDFENEESISLVEKQVAECAAIIEHLLADGEERVTNIRVANDAREMTRRFRESEKNKQLLKKLEDEAKLAQEKFDKISSQWSVILELSYPLDIEHEMNIQKNRCKDLIQQKDCIIKDLKEELKISDETFYKDLQKQLNDIKQLSERIDAQVNLMKNAYRTQLELIENTIEVERNSILQKNDKKWNALYEQRNENEIDNIAKKIDQIAEYKNKIDSITVEQREKHRETKIQLENEVETLQRELQELKTTCLINSEKIDYTYHILKRREEENLSIKSQQKRRLNKMQDVINELKKKINSAQKIKETEKTKANREVERIEKSISELHSKANHFIMVNEKKYQQVWKMNRVKCLNLISEINEMDKIIQEEVLGIDWTEPKPNLLKLSDLPSYRNAILNIENVSDARDIINLESDGSELNFFSEDCDDSKKRLIKHILTLIADTSGFLLEDKLWDLLNGYENIPNNICKIDNIFNALDIKSEDDISTLLNHFIKYCYCENCDRDIDNESDFINRERESFEYCKCHCGKQLSIKSNHVLVVLQDFIKKYKMKDQDQGIKDDTAAKSIGCSRQLTDKDVSAYWESYRNAFPPQTEKLCDNLTVGLTKYLPILQDRHKLNEEVTELRKQNSELKNLLRGHMPSGEVPKQKYLTPISKKFTFQ